MGWSNSGWQSDDGGWYKNKASGGGGGAPTFAVGGVYSNDSAGGVTTFTSPSLNIGTATATRVIAIGLGGYMSGFTGALSNVEVGSTRLTFRVSNGNTGAPIELWSGIVGVSEGSSAAISVTGPAASSITTIAIGIGIFDNLSSPAPSSTATLNAPNTQNNPYATTSNITVGSPGFGFAFATDYPFAPTSLTWNNMTPGAQASGASTQAATGYTSAAGAVSPSFNGGNAQSINMVAGAFS